MSNREDRLRSLLDKVRAKRPEERTTRAADALERIRTASGTTAAAAAAVQSTPPVPPSVRPTPVPSSFPTQAAPEPPPMSRALEPIPEPPTTPGLESPTRYSSHPPEVERPLSVQPRDAPSALRRAPSGRIRLAAPGADSPAKRGAEWAAGRLCDGSARVPEAQYFRRIARAHPVSSAALDAPRRRCRQHAHGARPLRRGTAGPRLSYRDFQGSNER